MLRIQDKLCKAATCLEYFTTHEWHFDDQNVRTLVTVLSEVDRREFCFDVAKIDWESYVESYVLGIRRYVISTFKNNDKQSSAVKTCIFLTSDKDFYRLLYF